MAAAPWKRFSLDCFSYSLPESRATKDSAKPAAWTTAHRPSSSRLAHLSLLESWKSFEEIALALPNLLCAMLLATGAAAAAAGGAALPTKLDSADLRLPIGEAALLKKSLPVPLVESVRWPSFPRNTSFLGGAGSCSRGETGRPQSGREK